MALYLGGEKAKINLGGVACSLNVFSSSQVENGVMLLSSDDYILKDVNGLLLLAKELD